MSSVKLRHLGEAERGRQQHGTAALPQHPRLGRSEPVPSRAEPSRSTQESLNNSQGQHRTSCFWCTPSSASRQPTEHHGNPSEELGQREPEGKPEEKRGCGHARGGTRGQPLTARGGRAPTAPHGPPRTCAPQALGVLRPGGQLGHRLHELRPGALVLLEHCGGQRRVSG